MAQVECLDKLKRRITLSIAKQEVQTDAQGRLRQIAKKARMPGFRPGKVPLKMIAQQHGAQVEREVLSDKIGKSFFAIIEEEKLHIAGQPDFALQEEASKADAYVFDATFEVYPEVKLGDIASTEITRMTTEIGDAEIDRAIDLLRKQHAHYHVRGEETEHGDGGSEAVVQEGDRVTVDATATMDGEKFDGGNVQDFVFVVGQGRALPDFEKATLGLKAGETHTFDLTFPENYFEQKIAGKTAQFTMTVKKVEWPHYPEIDTDFSKSLGIPDGDVDKMRAEIKENLEREAQRRTKLLLKEQVMKAVVEQAELDLPQALIEQEQRFLLDRARQDLKARGIPDSTKLPFSEQFFKEPAEQRVKQGLVLSELIKKHELQVKPEQIRAAVEEVGKSYNDPQEVMRWYYADQKRLAQIESEVLESNIVDFVLSQAKVNDKPVNFEELANASQ